ncbi:MAG: RraA family protein [Pseudomonadota bacterium]|nr:RraA family protein [Pseudomonadota bacterium]
MIGDPVALTIRRNISRANAELIAAFDNQPTGYVTDAFNGKGCLDYRIKPLDPSFSFCGSALTAFCGPMDNLAAMAALDVAKPGDVIVIATTNDETAAVIGDHWAYWAKKIGVVGVVCDGLVRDVVGLLRVGLPVFARGLTPNSGFRNGPGEVNLGVSCGGVTIAPGDIIVGDRDGVVSIPLGAAAGVAATLRLVQEKEMAVEYQLKRVSERKFWNEVSVQNRGGVRYLD